MSSIFNALPAPYQFLADQERQTKTFYLSDHPGAPGFKFVSLSYPGDSLKLFIDKTKNFKLSGILLFSNLTKHFEAVDVLIHNGLIEGLRISNSDYRADEFDFNQINVDRLTESEFAFQPSEADLVFNSLDKKNQIRIDQQSFMDIQVGNRTYYTIYDLEDGNYLGIDKKQNVYSLVHDATPASKLMNCSLDEILTTILSGEFDASKHLADRYKKRR
ncbi:MAG: hypothetical protein RIG68_15720 [Imperialibacter sp.]|uniref:hypothetical protein n=1 Tax=Imperialibacter sp. TaxID=2038411 RepID=UPI0032F087FD